MAPKVRFPEGPVTPHGAYHILHDRIPQMSLSAWDESVVFHLLGGLAIADRQRPGRAEVVDMSGLIPPWRIIDQKGATQDGVSFVDALYDAIDVELKLRIKGKDPADTRRVARYLYDSLDVKKTSRLAWFTHDLGYWWADLRWGKTPIDPVGGIKNRTQDVSLRLRADLGFWQSFPDVDDFVFGYNTAVADFGGADDLTGAGSGWTTAYTGTGSGVVQRVNHEIRSTLINGRNAIMRRAGFTSATNNQVVTINIGSRETWWFPFNAYNDIWARLNNTAAPGNSGVRLRIMRHKLLLSYFVGGVETVLRERILFIPPLLGEQWRLVAGQEGNERFFVVMRGSATVMTVKEIGTGSPLGVSNRSAGMGFGALNTEHTSAIRDWSVGTNSTVSQEKFMRRVNVGDQPRFDNYICYGPGTFRFWNGPGAGANEYIEFGPLLENQIMYVRSDPRKRGVVDMTSIPPSPQQLNFLQQALKDFLSFATGNNATPLAVEIESWFGIMPPQGNPYALLRGRWSDDAAIPPKSPGKAADPYFVKVSIDDGNANSKIICTGIPLRRMPY